MLRFLRISRTFVTTILLFLSLLLLTVPVLAELNFDLPAESAILIDAKTGQILWQKNAQTQMPRLALLKL